jgi:hypothetical protein
MADNNFAIRILLIVCAVAVLALLILQFNKKMSNKKITSEEKSYKENYTNVIDSNESTQPILINREPSLLQPSPVPQNQNQNQNQNVSATNVMASEPKSNEDYKAVDYDTARNVPTECYPKDKLEAKDLLPQDAGNMKWSEANPSGQGDVSDRNFLSAGFHIGTDTIGQSLRNPNYQLRSDPPNPQMKVGPWNQSTIEFDQARKHFEINDC